jgi:hypothetical protein
MRTGVLFYCDGCLHPLDDVICVGEAVSSRAISHGGLGDSAIGTNGDKCFFSAESPIGDQISKICPIRDMNVSDEEGPMCVVEAAILRDLSIKRINRVQVTPKVRQTSADREITFKQLPAEIRDIAVAVRRSCTELAGNDKTFNDMQGITILDLKGDGSRDIVVDNEGLCGSHMAGANCSNRSCDMRIYKETAPSIWRQIFHEHLYDNHLAIDWETMRLQLMIVSLYAGDPRCRPDPSKEYSSGKSCNLIVTYRNNAWNWQLIR